MKPLSIETQRELVDALEHLLIVATSHDTRVGFVVKRLATINKSHELLAKARAEMGGEP